MLASSLSSLPSVTLPSEREQEALQRLTAYLEHDQQQHRIWPVSDGVETMEAATGEQYTYTYDTRGQLTHIEEPERQSVHYAYDDHLRLSQVTHADMATTTYRYNEVDRLCQVCDRGIVHEFSHDAKGRLIKARRGNAGTCIYRYGDRNEVVEARTSLVSTQHHWNAQGQLVQIDQTLDGIGLSLSLVYDNQGRLSQLTLPGASHAIHYEWNADHWLSGVAWGTQPLARLTYDTDAKRMCIHYANGLTETSHADPVDGRPIQRQLCRQGTVLFQQTHTYHPTGQRRSDGQRHYTYDALGRLSEVVDAALGMQWHYTYDAHDNRTQVRGPYETTLHPPIAAHQPIAICQADGTPGTLQSDRWGRLRTLTTDHGQRVYRYDEAHRLTQVQEQGEIIARFTYDHKGRVVLSHTRRGTERYVYGADDTLLAVTDHQGRPRRFYIPTPLGLLAEIIAPTDEVVFRHQGDRGTCFLITNRQGEVVTQFHYTPYGVPIHGADAGFLPMFAGHLWHPEVQLYDLGARWYDPHLGRCLTPDSYTGAPDDERLVNPLMPGSEQALARAEILATWLKSPRVRNRYTYCNNDPVNRVDPNGHWSFGGVLLSILGAIWTLPNTVFGLLVEITCLVGEVIRWLVWVVTIGHVSWETPGFDAAASSHLNAFALVFEGGWIGSISGLLGITFGNVFFVNKNWRQIPEFSGTDPIYPPAYNGQVSIPRNQSLYEHELRHTNQYGWFGPFFHLGLPLFGVYEWDVIFNGYHNAWLERDARDHAEGPTVPTSPPPS